METGRQRTSAVLLLRGHSDGTLLALGREGGVWRSADGAATWKAIGSGLPSDEMRDLAVDPTNAARVYVVSKKAFYRSEDGGVNFSESKIAKDAEPESVAVDSRGYVYAATREGVFRSTDGGKAWKAFNEGLTNADVRALDCAGTRLYAETAGGGVFSIDLP